MQKNLRSLPAAAALAALAVAPSIGAAQGYQAAQFFMLNTDPGSISYTDLLPGDGIAPEMVFQRMEGAADYDFGSGPISNYSGAFDDVDPVTGQEVFSNTIGTTPLGPYVMTHGLTVTMPSTFAMVYSYSSMFFNVAPGTEVTFQAGYLNLMGQKDSANPVYGEADFFGLLSALIDPQGSASGSEIFAITGNIDGVQQEWSDVNPALGVSPMFGWSRLYTFTFSNPTANPLTAELALTGSIAGYTPTPAPVPEPTTHLLMAAGLLALLPALRRRKAG